MGEEAEHREEAEPVAPLAHRHTVGEQDGRQLLQPVGGYSKEDTGWGQLWAEVYFSYVKLWLFEKISIKLIEK